MNLFMNSTLIKKNDIFLVNSKNKKYVNDAIKNKASLIVTETNDIFDIKTIQTDNIYDYLYEYYKDKINKLTLIGITGTNGKTTVCYLIYQILNYMGIKTSYIGTLGYYVEDKIKPLNNTTPSIDILYNLLNDSYERKCICVVMEVSSHALKQNRVYKLLYDAIAVTNITEEHMDYHKDFNDYINTKKMLINKLRNNKICILNNKSKYYKKFINKNNNNIIIGRDIKIKKIINNIDATYIFIKDNDKEKMMCIPLIGKFNVYNFIMSYKIIESLYGNIDYVLNNIDFLKEPKGRLEKINYKNNSIFIDYAHTPDAVYNVLKTINKIKNNGVITIIGCGGNRDKYKRPIMAKIALKYSKYVIFTNDNPRLEDERKIIDDMLYKNKRKNYEIIYDRFSAIKKGIELLDDNMILMILGKGHEDYQIIGNDKKYFSDEKSVKNIINYK